MKPENSTPTAPFSPTAFRDLLYAILNRTEPLAWMDWLPVATVAMEVPERWIEVFTGLSRDKQYDLLELLSHPHAGPFADALLSILAVHAHSISNKQVRLNILDAAVGAGGRQEQRIAWIRDHLQTLSEKIGVHQDRAKDDFDLAAEIARKEKELAGLRAKEFYTEDRFSILHALEGEILHLETMQRVCTRYEKDRPEREAYLARLKAEVEELNARKQTTETAIGDAEMILEKLRGDVETAGTELEKQRKEIADLRGQKEEREATIRTLTTEIGKLKEEGNKQRSERQNLLDTAERLKGEIEERNALIKKDRKNLEALREDAATAGLNEIVNKIEELYRLLPMDKADEGIISRRR